MDEEELAYTYIESVIAALNNYVKFKYGVGNCTDRYSRVFSSYKIPMVVQEPLHDCDLLIAVSSQPPAMRSANEPTILKVPKTKIQKPDNYDSWSNPLGIERPWRGPKRNGGQHHIIGMPGTGPSTSFIYTYNVLDPNFALYVWFDIGYTEECGIHNLFARIGNVFSDPNIVNRLFGIIDDLCFLHNISPYRGVEVAMAKNWGQDKQIVWMALKSILEKHKYQVARDTIGPSRVARASRVLAGKAVIIETILEGSYLIATKYEKYEGEKTARPTRTFKWELADPAVFDKVGDLANGRI